MGNDLECDEKKEDVVENVDSHVETKQKYPWTPSSLVDNGEYSQPPEDSDSGEYNFD